MRIIVAKAEAKKFVEISKKKEQNKNLEHDI